MFPSLIILVILSVLYFFRKCQGNGPFGLPVIGYVPFLTQEPCEKLLKLSKVHGPVYSITIWGRQYFILNSFDSIKEALNDSATLGRPQAFSYMGQSFQHASLGALNGTKWRLHRKFAMTTIMGHAAMLRNCSTFLDVTEDLTEFIRSTKGRPTDYREPLSKTATNAITCVMYSKKYDWNDKELSYISTKVRHLFHMLQGLEFSYAGTIFGLFMKIVHRGRHSSVLKAAEDCTALFERMAESRLRNGVSHQRQDFFDHFLSNHKMDVENNVSQKDRLFSIKTLASTTFNLVLGAADTTADTMYWALYFLAKHPTAQRKVQQELDDVIGSRAVAMADRTSLPYTAAFIEETLRMGCLLPLTATREAVTDTSISGIKVPKGSYIVPNIYSALNDETYFKKPDTFDPTRFLNDGKFVSIEANCQFTLGKRSCVGQTFARVELFVIFCSVLQNFKVTFPCDNYEVGHTAGTSRSLLPYQLCMVERSGRL